MLVNSKQRNDREVKLSLSILYDDFSPVILTKQDETLLRILSEQQQVINDEVDQNNLTE